MKKFKRFGASLAVLAAVVLTLGAASSASAKGFTKLVAITTTNSVRIDLVPGIGEWAGVDFNATITRVGGDQPLWKGSMGPLAVGRQELMTRTVSDLRPELWNPDSPALYNLEVTATKDGQTVASQTVRIGFRSFEIWDGQFHLNGRPMFLRGIAINPPGRTIPDKVGETRAFAEAYVRYLKSQNVNIFRLTIDESQVWFDVGDELGMMMYAGHYGGPFGSGGDKQSAPKDYNRSIAEYRNLWDQFASHPSIVMYLLSNELPVNGERGQGFSEFLTRAHGDLKSWDATRPYIGNAGYGEGREGDVCDVHRYWGWYYNSFLTYYNLRDKLYPKPLFGDPGKNQPLTFTECVGSFTGWAGEFNIIRSKQLGAQLGWTGHTADQRAAALDYQSFMVKQATESFRRMRPLNPRLSGLMPFTILFYNWDGISSFDQMKPKPAMLQMGTSYQPVLLSWELWTPQVYSGTKVRAVAHVINDSENGRALSGATLNYQVRSKDKGVLTGKVQLPTIPYYGTWSQGIDLELPANVASGDYTVSGSVTTTTVVSTNSVDLFVAGVDWKKPVSAPETQVLVYDPTGKTAAALQKTGIPYKAITDLSSLPGSPAALVIGEDADDKVLATQKEKLNAFVRAGGRVLCLPPKAGVTERDWLPEKISYYTASPNDTHYPPRSRPSREQMNINLERGDHPIFKGLDRRRLSLWSDYSGWNQTKPGFPKVYPVTAGFKLDEQAALARTAVIADYDRGLEGIAVCEIFDGAGSLILCGFDLVSRSGLDPAADRMLANLVAYTAAKEGHAVHPMIDKPIHWGNYASEKGLIYGSLSGLIENEEWQRPPTASNAKPLAANTGSWNMEPGSQFLPRGRNPFGPYGYSTGSSLREGDRKDTTGNGVFWATIPAGKKGVVTKVSNPAKTSAPLIVSVNDMAATATNMIPAGQTVELRSPLPEQTTNVSVRYTGAKTLVLLETRFE